MGMSEFEAKNAQAHDTFPRGDPACSEIDPKEAFDSSNLNERMSSLKSSIDHLNEEVSSHSEKERWSAKRKLYYSSVMLSVTVILWGLWISLQFI